MFKVINENKHIIAKNHANSFIRNNIAVSLTPKEPKRDIFIGIECLRLSTTL